MCELPCFELAEKGDKGRGNWWNVLNWILVVWLEIVNLRASCGRRLPEETIENETEEEEVVGALNFGIKGTLVK